MIWDGLDTEDNYDERSHSASSPFFEVEQY